MDKQARVAYIMAQTVCAMAEIEGMKAANREARNGGKPEPYGELEFQQVPVRNQIDHNNVIEYLGG